MIDILLALLVVAVVVLVAAAAIFVLILRESWPIFAVVLCLKIFGFLKIAGAI